MIFISREEWLQRYKKCQVLLGNSKGSGLKEIHVPHDTNHTPNNSVQRWRSIASPTEMINYIIKQNKKQFSQARDTPLADTPLGIQIRKLADTQIAYQILYGTYDATAQIAEVTRFIQSCKRDPGVQTCVTTSAWNIKFHSEYKPGGTSTIVGYPLHTRVLAQDSDPNLGRWSYITLQAKNNMKITFLTVYRVCNQSTSILEPNDRIGSRNMSTFFTQQ